MADRLIVDLRADGRVSVLVSRGGELADRVGDSFDLAWPLDETALEDLRWYVEDYLRAPYGAFAARGERIAGLLPVWGQALFEALFAAGPVRDTLMELRARNPRLELVFRSPSAGWLGLPWELLRDPERPSPLVLDGMSVDRSLPSARLGQVFTAAGDRLRVLMVIARPQGTEDVGFRMVARPLLERLSAVRGQVDLVVLRPPTLDRLAEVLREAAETGRPFQVVHFDGHGVLAGPRVVGGGIGLDPLMFGATAQGLLSFEKPEGGADHVTADAVARVLAAGQVPVVVLNACQSGAVGKELEAAVATRLLLGGASSVVAMAFTVYAVAAAEFMAAFYERLFAGDTVSAAVNAGRARLSRENRRPSPRGLMPLADWLVPVHYVRRESRFPGLTTPRARGLPSLEDALDAAAREGTDVSDPLAPVGVFVGRDGLFYTLETAARSQRVIVLHGPGGTGKTELVKAFGRWWQDTDGVDHPALVLWHSFEPGVATFGLDGVVTGIGLRVFGTRFAQLDPDDRVEVVVGLLRDSRCLLIWDNFETVASMPDPAATTPPLTGPERDRLARFLDSLHAGASTVLITSRSPEPWLGGRVRRVPVPGLTGDEAVVYAGQLLAPHPAARRHQALPVFADLMRWLDGHPLSMRLTLPALDHTDPATLLTLLTALHGHTTSTNTDAGAGRTESLAACVAYSFAHLDPATADALTAVSLFQQTTDADVLAAFSGHPDTPAQFTGIDTARWTEILDQATGIGLLTAIGAGMYRIHPALPAYLTRHWATRHPDTHPEQATASRHALTDTYAAFSHWLQGQINTGDAGLALALIGFQRHTMTTALAHALHHHTWTHAQTIIAALDEYWDRAGLTGDADLWADRILDTLTPPGHTPPTPDTTAGQLWLYTTGQQASRHLAARRLDQAEHIYQHILTLLTTQPDTPANQHYLAATYHQLGMIAEDRGDLDQADTWYRQSLTITEQLGDRPGMARSYHQLGMITQARGDLDQADTWYRQSLTIKEQLGNRPGMATSYHQLGITAQDRGDLDQADTWYRQSLTIKEQLGDRPGMATSYHQLGNTAHLRGDLDQADTWYRQSLTIEEQLGDRPGMARSYHQLGMTAQDRGDLDQADTWYRQSLTIKEQLGNRPGMANSYGRLGLLAEARDNTREALTWMTRAVTLFDQFPHPSTGPALYHLRRLTSILGIDVAEQIWQDTTGQPMPPGIRAFLTAPEE